MSVKACCQSNAELDKCQHFNEDLCPFSAPNTLEICSTLCETFEHLYSKAV